jgi:DNA-binding NarL/FixJ family response regulator
MTIKLIIADDQEVIRKGVASLLVGEDIEIVAEATTGTDAVSKTKKHKPNVLLMDVLMPDMDGLDALEKIRKISPATNLIIMSAHDNPTYVARAAALGAKDFLVKGMSGKAFLASILRAVRGEASPADSLLSKIKAKLQTRPDPKADNVPLTRREYQVLLHLGYGLSNREIGYSLSISVETVKEHVQNIMRKLDTPDRTAAAYWAAKRGLV